LVSKDVLATCPVQPCKLTGEASTIAGSNADIKLTQLQARMTADGSEVAKSILDAANMQTSMSATGSKSIITTMLEMNQSALDTTMKSKKAMMDAEMAYMAEMAEVDYRSKVSVFGKNDTKEEIEFILNALEENKDLTVPEIIFMLKSTVDDNEEGKIPVRIASAKGVCAKEDVSEKGKCAKVIKIYPSTKLEKAFKLCSERKRGLVQKQRETLLRRNAIRESNKKTLAAMKSTDSAGAITTRIQENKQLMCSPTDYKSGVCGKNVTPEEYQEKIIIGSVIPNGDIAASNFTTPTSNNAAGYLDDLSEETLASIENQSLDRSKLERNKNQRVVPIVNTYRNVNQLKASKAFIDNIVGEDLVPNLSPQNRKKNANSNYQSRFLSRMSSLSLVRLALTDSMMLRVGTKLSGLLESDDVGKAQYEITLDSDNGKEDVLGAGQLDMLTDRVNRQFDALRSDGKAGDTAGSAMLSDSNPNNILNMQSEALRLQNEIMWKRFMVGEQSLALDAISNAQKANSPEMIEYMNQLRVGR
ncbi:MAG: hypothetical protein HAW67_03215, partial [Endozoicomonadaceae bacterium]|nr:hypothetical protein [Endozoicomonadaceae bacterium]